MADDTVQRLQRNVIGNNCIQHADTVQIVPEAAACPRMIERMQRMFTGMAERRMPHVMPDCDCFDQVGIQPKHRADIARNPRNKLYMQCPAGQIVIAVKRKDLRLVCIAVIERAVENLVRVLGKRLPVNLRRIAQPLQAADHVAVFARIR